MCVFCECCLCVVQRCPAECGVSELDQVQQQPSTHKLARYKEVRLRNKK